MKSRMKNLNRIIIITLTLIIAVGGQFRLFPAIASAASQNVNIPLTLPPNATDDPNLSSAGSGDHLFADWDLLRLTTFQAETASNKEAEALTTRLTLGSSGICQGAKFQSLSVSFHVLKVGLCECRLAVGTPHDWLFGSVYVSFMV